MRISQVALIDAPPAKVVELMQSEHFQREKAARLGAVAFEFSRDQTGDQVVVTTRRTVPTAGLPEFVRSMVKATMTAVETERWSEPLGLSLIHI